jgi:adenosine deaminase CECR1
MSRVKDLPWPSLMPDDEWAEVLEGIPAKDEPFINKYLDGREALIAQEKKQRSGKQDFFSKASPIDKKPRPYISSISLASC